MSTAEVCLCVGSNARFDGPQDGDIVSVTTALDIARINAQHIVFEKVKASSGLDLYKFTDSNGLLPKNGLMYKFMMVTSEILIQRISDDTVRYTRIGTRESWTERIPKTYLNFVVYQRIAGQLPGEYQRFGAPTFGNVDREEWFDGKTIYTTQSLAQVWLDITNMTGKLQSDNLLLPLSDNMGKTFANFRIEDLSAERAKALKQKQFDMTQEEYDEVLKRNPEAVMTCTRFRNYKIDWRSVLSSDSTRDVEDRNIYVDKRVNSLLTDAINVEAK